MSLQEVKLYVYDISRGMARQMSSLLLGKQIDGIWHTGIVCYGAEYFFGSAGIQCCIPGTLILGAPDEIIDLGSTEVPEELFNEYLNDVNETQFRGDQYHLLDWNCNTFSNEVSLFLTGRSIPEKIQNLPKEFLNTSLGAMLKPMIDSMSMRSPGGVPISQQRRRAQNVEEIFEPRPPESSARTNQDPSLDSNNSSPQFMFSGWSKEGQKTAPLVYDAQEIGDPVEDLKRFGLTEEQQESLDMINAMHIAQALNDFNSEQVKCLDDILSMRCQSSETDRILKPLSLLLQGISAYETPRDVLIDEEGSVFLLRFIQQCRRSNEDSVHIAATKVLVNISSSHKGREALLAGQGGVFEQREVIQLGISSLLAENKDQYDCGLALLFNISLCRVGEEVALECITALIEFIKTERTNTQVNRSLFALRSFLRCGGDEVSSLAKCLGLDMNSFLGRSEDIDEICEDINKLLNS